MRQRRWLKLLKNYDLTINYYPGMVNVVADALSRKNHKNLAMLFTLQQSIIEDMRRMEIRVRMYNSEALLANFRIQPTLIEKIKVT